MKGLADGGNAVEYRKITQEVFKQRTDESEGNNYPFRGQNGLPGRKSLLLESRI
jgi:hypothetical protein